MRTICAYDLSKMNIRNTIIGSLLCIFILILMCSAILVGSNPIQLRAQDTNSQAVGFDHPLPTLNDPNLKVEVVADGLKTPTGMLFLDKDNILVLQRYTSGFPLGGLTTVNLVRNGSLLDYPVLTVLSGLCDIKNPEPECFNFNERGLLGIAARKINVNNASLAGNLEVFLYYTEVTLNGEALGNRIYKYIWDGQYLINPKLILDLPALPGPNHNAGKC